MTMSGVETCCNAGMAHPSSRGSGTRRDTVSVGQGRSMAGRGVGGAGDYDGSMVDHPRWDEGMWPCGLLTRAWRGKGNGVA